MGRPLALDGRCLMGGQNNQPNVSVNGEGGVGEETQPGRNVWGRCCLFVLGGELNDKKNRK